MVSLAEAISSIFSLESDVRFHQRIERVPKGERGICCERYACPLCFWQGKERGREEDKVRR